MNNNDNSTKIVNVKCNNNRSCISRQNDMLKGASLNLLLEAAHDEYDRELARSSTIDSKAGIALPILATYSLSLAQMSDYASILDAQIADFTSLLLPLSIFLSYTTTLLASLLASIWMARAVIARPYERINPIDLYDVNYLHKEKRILSLALTALYLESIEYNRNSNASRMRLYQHGWIFALVSLSSFIYYIILKNIA